MNRRHPNSKLLEELRSELAGELFTDSTLRKLYSTDASIYQQIPLAVAIPKSDADIACLIKFANQHQIGLIPRTAGTSLAGQVVGDGIVVDVSKHLTDIIEVNQNEKQVRVQPGVIRDELNLHLKEHGLFFGPETSTSNRAMIGGMFGNNSCGSNSIFYGTTRDQLHSVKGFLSDGSQVAFGPLTGEQFKAKLQGEPNQLETQLYQRIQNILSNEETQNRIRSQFPKPSVSRRNTGYAIDTLLDSDIFGGDQAFNFCKLLAGSEGTLFLATELQFQCHELPPTSSSLICAHFRDLNSAMRATQIAMRHKLFRCELVDRLVIQGASRNANLRDAAAFFEDDPVAVLLVEARHESADAVRLMADAIVSDLVSANLGYHHPILHDQQTEPIWQLRRAGLGVVGNVIGDAKPTTFIEDTAVAVEDLPNYIDEIDQLLTNQYDSPCVFYGHAGAGELHLRPILNLKTDEGRKKLRAIATDVATIVKKYRGSLSGEHGDGRLRGEFLQSMIGRENYKLLCEIKQLWDPGNVFNPGKIIDTPPMSEGLRSQDSAPADFETVQNFESAGGLLAATELCTGSGDCLKSHLSGGTMCPSYMATRNEKDSTRARANILRHALNDGFDTVAKDSVREVMKLCLSCKACKSECPSNVDVAKLKAEFMQSDYDANGVPFRTRLMGAFDGLNKTAALLPGVSNFVTQSLSPLVNRMIGVHSNRRLPKMHKTQLRKWFARRSPSKDATKKVHLFCDEFSEFHDVGIGIAAIELLESLGYEVVIPEHRESGRVLLSMGLLRKAKAIAEENVNRLAPIVTEEQPIVGLEPSAILTFRDEYPDLVDSQFRQSANRLAGLSFTIEEFLVREFEAGRIERSTFGTESKTIYLHGHCHQKALGTMADTVRALQLPTNYQVKVIPSGCCGMAGSFGYMRENYDISMQIGEMVLFPRVREIVAADTNAVICAPGTSCRHQIMDGTNRKALHPTEILLDAIAGDPELLRKPK